jgi:hypothetical protein
VSGLDPFFFLGIYNLNQQKNLIVANKELAHLNKKTTRNSKKKNQQE